RCADRAAADRADVDGTRGADADARAACAGRRRCGLDGGPPRRRAMMAALAVTAMTLGELLGPSEAGDHAAARVQDLVLSSADVRPGAAFVALAGTRAHGMHYAAD